MRTYFSLRKCERARCRQVPVRRREQRARRPAATGDPPLRISVSEFSADDPYPLALLAAVEQNLLSRQRGCMKSVLRV
jgi:hypothetical protein